MPQSFDVFSGASEVFVSDISTERLARAERFGATACFLSSGDGTDLVAAVRERTADCGVGLIVEVSGSPAALEASLQALRIGGTVVFVGPFLLRDCWRSTPNKSCAGC